MKLLPIWLTFVTLALVGCGTDADRPAAPLETVTVRGFLWTDGEEIRLCDAIAESYPPQCGGDFLRVERLDLSTVSSLESADGISWAEGVELEGRIQDGRLLVLKP